MYTVRYQPGFGQEIAKSGAATAAYIARYWKKENEKNNAPEN
ncbi:MAG: hypothetical protein ACTHWQ_09650 [Sphingobacterium sp.]